MTNNAEGSASNFVKKLQPDFIFIHFLRSF